MSEDDQAFLSADRQNIQKPIGVKKQGEGPNTNGAIHCGGHGPVPIVPYSCWAEGDTLQQKAIGDADGDSIRAMDTHGLVSDFCCGPIGEC